VADPVTRLASGHQRHDRALVAALAADDLAGTERHAAAALVAGCAQCAALHADLVAIASATRTLPAPLRTRDFRLTPEVAAGLESNRWRRLGDWFRRPAGLARPLAVTFTTLGLAGLLVSAMPALLPFGSSAAAPAGQEVAPGASPAASTDRQDLMSSENPDITSNGAGAPAASVQPAPEASDAYVPNAAGGDTGFQGSGASPGPTDGGDRSGEAASGGDPDASHEPTKSDDGAAPAASAPPVARPAPNPVEAQTISSASPPWLLILSLAMLVLGIGLFAARRIRPPH
jgi:hypothetical protein